MPRNRHHADNCGGDVFSQMVKLRGLPFRPNGFPALDEYGATMAQATLAEDSAMAEIALSRTAGRLETFTGEHQPKLA